MAGSDSFTFRNWREYRESALTVGRVGPWLLYPGVARIEVSLKWKELFGDGRLAHHGGSEGTEGEGRGLRVEGRGFDARDDGLFSREPGATCKDGQAVHGTRRLWGPETFPEYLGMIRPGDRERVASGALRAFLTGDGAGGASDALPRWEATFRRGGLVILARAKAVSPGYVVGVDIDVTGLANH
jgi:hypothetical protein